MWLSCLRVGVLPHIHIRSCKFIIGLLSSNPLNLVFVTCIYKNKNLWYTCMVLSSCSVFCLPTSITTFLTDIKHKLCNLVKNYVTSQCVAYPCLLPSLFGKYTLLDFRWQGAFANRLHMCYLMHSITSLLLERSHEGWLHSPQRRPVPYSRTRRGGQVKSVCSCNYYHSHVGCEQKHVIESMELKYSMVFCIRK